MIVLAVGCLAIALALLNPPISTQRDFSPRGYELGKSEVVDSSRAFLRVLGISALTVGGVFAARAIRTKERKSNTAS